MSETTDAGPDRSRLGLGLAAVGRPGYINLGRELPAGREVEALRARSHELLDAAYAGGVRYVDLARSYGRAEEFAASWLRDGSGGGHPDVRVGSKWGYTYTAGWRVDAEVHETKDHSVATFDRQLAETRALLGDRLSLYQIHSVTPDSTALTDAALHGRLADLAATGVTVGLSTSGPRQADTIRAALAVPVLRSAQVTWNLLERSAAGALAEWAADGRAVIVKEALANGRLAVDVPPALADVAAETGATPDVVALAVALRQPWATTVLSGASTVAQLRSNLRAADLALTPAQLARLDSLAEAPADYWRTRSALPWR
jgi:aryl-alcohol dehydrogenase-like predicted oxidoreductase